MVGEALLRVDGGGVLGRGGWLGWCWCGRGRWRQWYRFRAGSGRAVWRRDIGRWCGFCGRGLVGRGDVEAGYEPGGEGVDPHGWEEEKFLGLSDN